MDTRQLSVELRSATGSSALKSVRRAGSIPAVIYSEGKDSTSIQMTEYDYGRAVIGNVSAQLFELKCENKEIDGQLAILKDVQIEPIKDKVLHVDFLAISKGQTISVSVPITLIGEAPAVKLGEAVLNVQTHEVEVDCIPSQIPDELTLDISSLGEGESLHISDLIAPEGVEIKSDPGLTVASTVAKRAEVEETTEEPLEGELAEGEVAEGEGEGETPAGEEKAAE